MTVEIISLSISTKVWGRAGIKLATPGSAVRLTSVARHVTDCTMQPVELLIAYGSHKDTGEPAQTSSLTRAFFACRYKEGE